MNDPACTRDDLRLNHRMAVRGVIDPNTGDDLLEAVTIMQDVVKRRRRVFGPTHPDTILAEEILSKTPTRL